MSDLDILVTGTPRSGTTLTCHLLNKVPDTVALHEPMKPKRFVELADKAAICDAIADFCAEQRLSIRTRGRALSKNVGGQVPDNPVGTARSAAGLRKSIASKGYVVVDKPLSPDFALVVKHNSSFTAVLDALVERFPVFAVVRNPLATLSSWNSVNFNVQEGHALAGERLDPALTARLEAIADPLDRQIALLAWFHSRFLRYLPPERILRYEEIVSSGGRALAVIRPAAADLAEPLASRNASDLYDPAWTARAGERLLAADGAFWETYPRSSVEELLAAAEQAVGSRGREPAASSKGDGQSD